MCAERPPSRRDVLRAVAAGTATTGLAGCLGGDADDGGTATDASSFATYPVGKETVTFGATIPRSGPYSADGEEQRRGFELAVEHINEGGGWVGTDQWNELGGDGLLGRTVTTAVADTESSASTAADGARRLVEDEGAVTVVGGGSTNAAKRVLDVCQPAGVVHMFGFAPGTNVTGVDCGRYGFQEMYGAKTAANALAPVLRNQYEGRVRYYQLHADSDYGFTQADQFERRLQEENWSERGKEKTRVGTENFEPQLTAARDADVDVVVLSYRGTDGANAIRQAKQTLADDTGIVVPVLSQTLADFAGAALEGVLGTIAWDPTIETPLTSSFAEAFRGAYEDALFPSDQAHLAYVQTLQYAAAVERAGTFRPDEVVRELEGLEYAAGMGAQTMRACDHRAVRPVPIVRGLPEAEQTTRRTEFVDRTRDVTPACDEFPASNCTDLGPYEPGTE